MAEDEIRSTPYSFPARKQISADNVLLMIIILAGIILRFYRYGEVPYTYDELSALFRTDFESFRELIRHGVKLSDMHPAGIQVFLWYWVKWFGDGEQIVKLPFVITGILSIPMGYFVGRRWFGETAGIMTALFLSITEYATLYSLLARPYAVGLFLCLALTWFWTKIVFDQGGSRRTLNYAGFILSCTLCAYTHYFSMLFAVMAGLTGLFLINRKEIRHYVGALAASVLLFSPHIPITLHQIGRKGLPDWLGEPSMQFFLEYPAFIFHFSALLVAITGLIILSGFFTYEKSNKRKGDFRIVAFLWFLIPLLTGYFYSVFVSPVLQYSILIFTFPFAIMFLFSHFGKTGGIANTVIVLIFGTVAIHSLTERRQFYRVFHTSAFEETIKNSIETKERMGKEEVSAFVLMPRNVFEFYRQRMDPDDQYRIRHIDRDDPVSGFMKILTESNTSYIALGMAKYIRPIYRLLIEEHYPQLLIKENYYLGSFFLFCSDTIDKDSPLQDATVFRTVQVPSDRQPGWEWIPEQMVVKPDENILHLTADDLYSPGYFGRISDITSHKNNIVFISVDFLAAGDCREAYLVSEIKSGEETIDWRSAPLSGFIAGQKTWSRAGVALNMADVRGAGDHAILRTFIWKDNCKELYINNFMVEVKEGNKLLYSLFEDY